MRSSVQTGKTGGKVLLEGDLDKKADHAGLIGSSWQSKQVVIYFDGAVEYHKKGDKDIRRILKVLDINQKDALLDLKAVVNENEDLKSRTFHFRAKNEQQAGRWKAALQQAKEARTDMEITFAENEDLALIGPLEPVDAYVSKSDRSHLRLGISAEGMWAFLEEIKFITYAGKEEDKSYWKCRGWKYAAYERRPEAKWIDDQFGLLQEDEVEGQKNITGYDVVDFIKQWLVTNESVHLSVCEVILLNEALAHLRKHVKRASIFWSHMHKEPLLRNGTLDSLERVRRGRADELPPEDQQIYFLDYFSVRQAKPMDFKPAAVAALVGDIGHLVSSIDQLLEYPSRSWCVLEIHAALSGKAKLVCDAPINRAKVEELLLARPVTAANAITSKDDDKPLIDAFLQKAVGFEVLDKIVNGAITQGVTEEPVPPEPEPVVQEAAPEEKSPKSGGTKGKKAGAAAKGKAKDAKGQKGSTDGKEGKEKAAKKEPKKNTGANKK